MSRRQLIATWTAIALLHFIGTSFALTYGFGSLVDAFFGRARPSVGGELGWAVAKVLLQPGATLFNILGVRSDFAFWLIAGLNSALWGAVLVLVTTVIHRRLARTHAF